MKPKRFKNSVRGFTLVEMMVVISIIVILLGVAMPIYSQSVNRAREDAFRDSLLTLNQTPDTAYVDTDGVAREVQYARRMFADNGWPVIDVTRRSIEETAAAVINLLKERQTRPGEVQTGSKPI